ncbi:hypothetical protein [Diaphorobacter sp. LR2014-1]|uniref:hypothetical protein n=1 Tax=Diaphorobacter sp. LR2014-1 TaxID=1933219 RepID=UPI000CDAEA40|nr:hypothetical protein [Diaphorobacter sp. LR2014-1]POR07974.1 hypothetical protein BV908_18505 [Diaphorobacter sp. LR2014-1]
MATQARDYTEFDKKMLDLIAAGKNTAAALTTALDAEAKPLMNQPNEEFRVIDRRLQALRKKGDIAWERRGALVVWSLTK